MPRCSKAIAIAEKQKAESANKALLSSQDSLRSTLYAAQMNLTKVAWDSGTPSRTLDLLAATTPKSGEPDPRGFEWHYWRRTAHGERTVRKLPGLGRTGFSESCFQSGREPGRKCRSVNRPEPLAQTSRLRNRHGPLAPQAPVRVTEHER